MTSAKSVCTVILRAEAASAWVSPAPSTTTSAASSPSPVSSSTSLEISSTVRMVARTRSRCPRAESRIASELDAQLAAGSATSATST